MTVNPDRPPPFDQLGSGDVARVGGRNAEALAAG